MKTTGLNGSTLVDELHRCLTVFRRLVSRVVIDRAVKPYLSMSGLVINLPLDALLSDSNRCLSPALPMMSVDPTLMAPLTSRTVQTMMR